MDGRSSRCRREVPQLVGAPETMAKVREIDPVASHASWMENFPWTRLKDVVLPAEQKPTIDMDRLRVLSPEGVRAYLGDGNFGGYYERPDEDMLAIWSVAVEETRQLIEGPGNERRADPDLARAPSEARLAPSSCAPAKRCISSIRAADHVAAINARGLQHQGPVETFTSRRRPSRPDESTAPYEPHPPLRQGAAHRGARRRPGISHRGRLSSSRRRTASTN